MADPKEVRERNYERERIAGADRDYAKRVSNESVDRVLRRQDAGTHQRDPRERRDPR